MAITPIAMETDHFIGIPNGSPAFFCRERSTATPLGRAMLIGRQCMVMECLRAEMKVRGIETNARPFEQSVSGGASDYDIFVIFMMHCTLSALQPVKQRVSELRSFMSGVPCVALIEDSDAAGVAACRDIGFSTVVLGLPSVTFAVDVVVNLLLLGSHHARDDSVPNKLADLPPDICAEKKTSVIPAPEVSFTSRELELLDFLRHGMQNKHIAFELGISQSTVKAHLRSIMMKLKAKNRTEAACMLAQVTERAKEIIHG